jgi:hypothetical protein
MALYTTLFAATEAELSAMFPGWLVPRATPLERESTNPFSGETMSFLSWLPDSAAGLEGLEDMTPQAIAGARAISPVLEPAGARAAEHRQLEVRAPPALRALPHASLVDVYGPHLDALAAALEVPATGRPARVAPDATQLDSLPDEAVTRLAACDEQRLPGLVKAWAFTEGLFEGADPTGDALWALRAVHALARLSAGHGRRVCVFVELP